jgi:hypothetical protein
MTDRPILFSAEMVRAILDGRKTQTRRIIKPQPPAEAESVCRQLYSQEAPEFDGAWTWWAGKPQKPITKPLFCPYGKPGDLLWVRETWARHASGVDYAADFAAISRPEAGPWRPSIHMPRWASRITLRITDIRVERLQDISEDDALAEGCEARPFPGPWWQGYRDLGDGQLFHQQAIGETAPDWMIGPKQMPPTPWLDQSARDGFRSIWMGLHGPGAWDDNPWVWVISFQRVTP